LLSVTYQPLTKVTKTIIKTNDKTMARIIYKEGCEGQNTLESIEGIEIKLLNGQKALIYPKYETHEMFDECEEWKWITQPTTEIEALKNADNIEATEALLKYESPAAVFVSQFHSKKYGAFGLPTLIAVIECQDQKQDIDRLAETIEGADLLKDFTRNAWSCSHYFLRDAWLANDIGVSLNCVDTRCLCIPIALY
jgi:hypothetical protein